MTTKKSFERRTSIDHAPSKTTNSKHLRRTRNAALSLPFCLPNEILAEIFQNACETSIARSTTLKSVSHVCHLWRQVALGCGKLWIQADYDHDHPEWVNAQLRRSANMPIIVKAHFPMQSRGMQNLRLALKVPAIHTLDIQASPDVLDQVWESLNAASLRTLSLFIPWSQMPKDIPYPGPTFQLNSPHLRTLALSNFIISWDAALFKNLTHLRLHLQDQTFAPSMTQILGMLSSSPMLTELTLLHAIEASSRLPCPESVSVVPLPHVATLLLDDDILNHIFILCHIDIPTHCNVTLKVDHRTKKMGLITEIGHSISQSLSLGELDKLSVEAEPSGVSVRGYTTALSPMNARIQITLRYLGSHSEMDTASVAGAVLSSLHPIAATALEVSFRDPHSSATPEETWRMWLQNSGAVETLQVKPTTPRNLFSALAVSKSGLVLLPRLRTLEIHHSDVDPTLGHEVGRRKPVGHLGNWWQKIEAPATFFDNLLACLKSRQRLEVGISSLRLGRSPQFSAQELGSLKSVVKDISWCP
ncbi:hypothetical protein FB451DRAFT_751743 [Mycena latifolia]|nr:hypothetical protein FB451DRAFT_751743 [Mycena latifolia]